jgi:hypothetical protein
MTPGTAGSGHPEVHHPEVHHPEVRHDEVRHDGGRPGHDHSTKVMAAVVALALAGVLVAAILFVTTALLSPRPVL